jgi:Cys-rich repeat protein
MKRLHLVLLAGLLLPLGGIVLSSTGCGSDPCAGVRCSTGECNSATGRCTVPPDAGVTEDAGVVEEDAGTDAGTLTCPGPCTGATPICDPASGTCKTCTASTGCSGLVPTCDTTANGGAGKCVVCTATSGCSAAAGVCDTSVAGGRCVECLENSHCPSGETCDTQVQLCTGSTNDGGQEDAGTTSDAGTPDDAGTAEDAGTAQDAGTDPDAGTPQDAGISMDAGTPQDAGTADAGQVLPDTCLTSQLIVFPSGSNSTTFMADTSLGMDDYNGQGVCATSSVNRGPDLVYRLNLTMTRTVSITATPPAGSASDPVLYVRSSPCETGMQLTCSDAPLAATPESVTLPGLAPGDYFIFIDSYLTSSGAGAGPVEVTVTLSP